MIRVIFSTFPSHDAHFELFDATAPTEHYVGRVEGYKLEVLGDGFIYGSGHINSSFDQKRKYAVTADGIREIRSRSTMWD